MDFGIIHVLSNVYFLCVTVLLECYFLKNGHVQAYVFDASLLDFTNPHWQNRGCRRICHI